MPKKKKRRKKMICIWTYLLFCLLRFGLFWFSLYFMLCVGLHLVNEQSKKQVNGVGLVSCLTSFCHWIWWSLKYRHFAYRPMRNISNTGIKPNNSNRSGHDQTSSHNRFFFLEFPDIPGSQSKPSTYRVKYSLSVLQSKPINYTRKRTASN